MTKFYFSCDEVPRHWDRYFERCNAVEIDLQRLDNPPRIKTLNRWRVESPRGFAYVLHVDPDVVDGLDRASSQRTELSDQIRRGWETTLERAQALSARALLLRTPSSFAPGDASRDLMRRFAEELAADFSRPVIWEARGMWDVETTRQMATELGLTYAYDPFLAMRDDIEFHHGDGAFVLTERAGMRREFDRYDIRDLLDALRSYNRAFMLLRGRFKWEHARHFRDLLDEPSWA